MTAIPIDRMSTLALEDALARLDAGFLPLPSEEAAVQDALDRVLAADAVAPADFPPFDRALVNGLALRSAGTVGASAYNPLSFRIETRSDALAENVGQLIAAGERLPAGADCVIPSELVQLDASNLAEIIESVAPESGMERRSNHFRHGTSLLVAGRRLRPCDIALLAAAGLERVTVIRRPRIAIVLVPGGSAAEDLEADAGMLGRLLERDGGTLVGMEHVDRTAADIRQAVSTANADLVLVVGGPARTRDRHFATLLAESAKLEFAEIALTPGGNIAMGFTGSARLFILPAAPVACFWAYEIVVGRALRRLAGRNGTLPFRGASMRLGRKIVSTIGMTEICPVRRSNGGVEPSPGSSPENLLALARSDGFVIVPEGSEGMPAGANLQIYMFDDIATDTTP
jgi:molybdopterin molybdotransferase